MNERHIKMAEAKFTCPLHKFARFSEVGKCPECLALEEKKKKFAEKPGDYVRVDSLVMAAKYDTSGNMMIAINHSLSKRDLHYAYGELSSNYREVLAFKTMMAQKKMQSSIIKPGDAKIIKKV